LTTKSPGDCPDFLYLVHLFNVSHTEQHLKSSALIAEVVIGMSDGLIVPFALAAGLSGAVTRNNIVVTQALQRPLPVVLPWGLADTLLEVNVYSDIRFY
jgi:hypothetical protein